jgi:hypothetical protein
MSDNAKLVQIIVRKTLFNLSLLRLNADPVFRITAVDSLKHLEQSSRASLKLVHSLSIRFTGAN